jgi:hypothetical protein
VSDNREAVKRLVKLEKMIGAQVAAARDGKMTQAELGERVGRYLGKQWSRQTVSAAEKGGRAFTALELLALSTELDVPLSSLLSPVGDEADGVVETPGGIPIPVARLLPGSGSDAMQGEIRLPEEQGATKAQARAIFALAESVDRAADALMAIAVKGGSVDA